MLIYLGITVLFIILAIRYDFNDQTVGRDFCYFTMLVILVLVAGLRWRLGIDTMAYIRRFYYLYPTFDKLSASDFGLGSDPFYMLINVFVKSLGGRFYMVQIIEAAIVNFLVFKYIKKHTRYIFTCALFYFFISYINYNMEVMRGSLSIAICLFGNDYILEKKWWKGYALYLIALMFHFQTIVLFILPMFFFIRFNKLGIALLVVAFIAGMGLQEFLGEYAALLEEGSGEVGDKVSDYASSGRWGVSHGNMTYYFSLILVKIIYPIFSLLYIKKYSDNEDLKRMEPFIMFGLGFVLVQMSFPIAFRYVYYYEVYFALIHSYVLVSIVKNNVILEWKLVYMKAFIFFFPVLLYYGYNKYRTNKYHPYTSIFEMKVSQVRENGYMSRSTYLAPNKNEY